VQDGTVTSRTFADHAKGAVPLKFVPGLNGLRCELLAVGPMYAPLALIEEVEIRAEVNASRTSWRI